jgi:hypothetical protein
LLTNWSTDGLERRELKLDAISSPDLLPEREIEIVRESERQRGYLKG